jgi:pyruvate dehydrogenase E2 component (dihydrolipoamide acetyltransferase)
MPKLSDTMEEGVVSTWLAEEGDAVEAGDVIAQVETDKATMDLEVFDDGVLLKKVVEEGATVPLGELLVVLGEEGEDPADVLAEYGGDGAAAEAPADEADEADEEEPSDAAETPEDEATPEDEDAGTQHDGASHENGSAPADESEDEATPQQSQQPAPSGENGRLRASPLARNMASENDIDLAGVEGSGPQGRIIKRDIEAILSGEKEAAPAGPEATPAGDGAHERPAEAVPQPEEDLYEAEPISQMRETIARRLAASKFTAPHFYLTVDALKDHPQVNASYLEDEGEVRRYKQVHVGVAVAVEEGLLTPVIRHADRKGLVQIAEETRELAGKARDKELQPEEYEGATFTTSNLGMFGIEEFTAIINPPNACILAIGAVREEPVLENGVVVPGQRMKLTLSCDHRVVDGATGADFLQTLQGLLEEPVGMLL